MGFLFKALLVIGVMYLGFSNLTGNKNDIAPNINQASVEYLKLDENGRVITVSAGEENTAPQKVSSADKIAAKRHAKKGKTVLSDLSRISGLKEDQIIKAVDTVDPSTGAMIRKTSARQENQSGFDRFMNQAKLYGTLARDAAKTSKEGKNLGQLASEAQREARSMLDGGDISKFSAQIEKNSDVITTLSSN